MHVWWEERFNKVIMANAHASEQFHSTLFPSDHSKHIPGLTPPADPMT